MDWFDLLAVQGTLKSLLQHHSSKSSILHSSAFFIVQLSHLYMTTGKIIALTRRTFVGKVMSLLCNMLSRLVMAGLPQSAHNLLYVPFFTSYSLFFQLWYWRRLLRVPWTARRSNQSILTEISPEYSLEGLMLKPKLQYFGHLIQRADSLEKTRLIRKDPTHWRRP